MTATPFAAGDAVCAYLRDSGGADQDLSVAQQESELRAWCQRQGLRLTRVFADAARPGSSTVGRDQFLEMLRYLRSAKRAERGVVIWKFSRFARDIDDAQYFKADLRRRGYEIYSIKDQIPEGSTGRFFESALDWMNQRFLEDLSTDVKRGLHHIVSQYGAVPGTPPRGFRRESVVIGQRRDGSPHSVARWVPDPDLVEAVRTAWRMRAAGASYAEIHAATRLYGSLNSYVTFFRNPIYKGLLEYGGQSIPDYCEPVVDPATWELVQELQAKSAERYHNQNDPSAPQHPGRHRSRYLLSGLAYCAACGSLLIGDSFAFGQGQRRYYYQCGNARRTQTCAAKKIPQDALEEAVIATLGEYILSPQVVSAQQLVLDEDAAAGGQRLETRREQLRRDLAAVERRLSRLADLLIERGSSATLLAKLDELEADQRALKNEQAELDLQVAVDAHRASLDDTQRSAALVRDNFRRLDLRTQKTVLRGLIARIGVERDGRQIRGLIEYYQPPADLIAPEDLTGDVKKKLRV